MGNYTPEEVQKYMGIAVWVHTASFGTALKDGSLNERDYFEYFQGVYKTANEVPEELRTKDFKESMSRLEKALKEYDK